MNKTGGRRKLFITNASSLTTLSYQGTYQVKTAEKKLQDALDKLCEWACKWGMSFNVKKCKVMLIGHANEKGACDGRPETVKPLCKGCQHGYKRAAADPEKLRLPRQINVCETLHPVCGPQLGFDSPSWSPWHEGDKFILEKV
jgi:hypothetical protein